MPDPSTGPSDGPSVTISNLRNAVEYLDRFRAGHDRVRIAAEFGMTPSGLRKLLAPIEARLNVTLAERDDRDAGKLVPPAEEFLAGARKLVEDYDALFSPRAFGVHRVRVGVYASVAGQFVARRVLPALLRPDRERPWAGSPDPFPARFPLHQLEWANGSRMTILREVERGTLDFGIADHDAGAPATAAGGFAWLPLYESAPFGGFLYHRDNQPFDKAAAAPDRFSLDALRGHTLLVARWDTRAVRDSLLPDPFPKLGTRCYLPTYRDVYEAVRANAGVGVGFAPRTAAPDDPVRSLSFAAVRCPAPRDQEVIDRLKGRGASSFGVYVRGGWKSPHAEGGLSEAAKFVLGAVQAVADGYRHDYVSDPGAEPAATLARCA